MEIIRKFQLQKLLLYTILYNSLKMVSIKEVKIILVKKITENKKNQRSY